QRDALGPAALGQVVVRDDDVGARGGCLGPGGFGDHPPPRLSPFTSPLYRSCRRASVPPMIAEPRIRARRVVDADSAQCGTVTSTDALDDPPALSVAVTVTV